MKKCGKCKKEKETSSFYKNKSSYDGLTQYCKDCLRIKDKNRREIYKEKFIKAGPSKDLSEKACCDCKVTKSVSNFYLYPACATGYSWYCKECSYKRSYKSGIKKKYGITLEDVNRMLLEQKGLCSICFNDISEKFYIDHDHTSKNVRSLLCINCNSLIGQAKEDVRILQSAINYLRKHNDDNQ